MFKGKNVRIWSTEEKFLEYKLYTRKILKSSLAVESYKDFTGDKSEKIANVFKELKIY